MDKNNLQLISARIDPDTLARVDKFAERHCYWKRNTIINNILMSIFQDFNDRQIYDMVRRNLFKKQNVECHYEISDYVKRDPKEF